MTLLLPRRYQTPYRTPTFPVANLRLPGTRPNYFAIYRGGLAQLGDDSSDGGITPQQGQAIASGITATGTQVMAGNYVTAVGSALMTGAAIPSPASPFLAIAGGAAMLLGAIGIGKGCGQTCIQATQYVNRAEPLLQQNIQTYFALPAPRYASAQAAALAMFDEVWNGVVQSCSNPSLGSAGQKCITDRQSGACTFKQTSTSSLLQYPGEPQPGQCWNWFSGYRDPIAADQTVPDPPASSSPTNSGGLSSMLGNLTAGGSGSMLLLLAIGAIIFGSMKGGSNG